LQQALLDDGCYLPWTPREIPEATRVARLIASGGEGEEDLRNGWGRPIGDVRNGWSASSGDSVTYEWDQERSLQCFRVVFDSDLNRECFGKGFSTNMPCRYNKDFVEQRTPSSLVRSFRVEALKADGSWESIWEVEDNHQRLVRTEVDVSARAVRLVIDRTWGDERVTVFESDAS